MKNSARRVFFLGIAFIGIASISHHGRDLVSFQLLQEASAGEKEKEKTAEFERRAIKSAGKQTPSEQGSYRIDAKIPEAKQSVHSDQIFLPLKRWPLREIPSDSLKEGDDSNPVWMRAIRTSQSVDMIGVLRQVQVNTPLKRVVELIQAFESYPEFFKDVKKVKILSQDRNKWTVFWERASPVFLVANPKYEQIYIFDSPSPKKQIIRYQLKSGNSVKFTDGFIVLEEKNGKTIQTGLDFYEVNWGILGSLGRGRIWKESLEGSYLGDLALKYRAENPQWATDKIEAHSRKILEKFPVEPIEYLTDFSWN